jgi:steroid 5-alpha reductase family enzyme
MSGLWVPLAIGAGAACLSFAVAWWFARRIDNYSLVDPVWAFGIGLTGAGWLVAVGGNAPKQWIAAALLAAWSGRLGWHLQKRIRKAHPEEDSRYAKLRRSFGNHVSSAFLGVFEIQAASAVLLALPFLFIAADRDHAWGAWETFGSLVALGGIAGEGIADAQMARFKERKPEAGAVCREGLWNWSRHPNYFFEFVIWLGFYLYACGSEWGRAMVHAPAIVLFLLLRVTGIPPTEASAVRRKGDAYRIYQRTTSAFVPWPPKTRNHNS